MARHDVNGLHPIGSGSCDGDASTLQIREFRINPCLDEFVKLCGLLHNLLSLGVCRDLGTRVVNHIAFATARLKVVSVFVGSGTDSKIDAIERHLVMSGFGGHAVACAGDCHVRRQQGCVVCGCEPAIPQIDP